MTRKRVGLDGQWEFFLDPEQRLSTGALKDPTLPRRAVRVPGPWQAQFEDLRAHTGVAWYRREFELPADGRAQQERTHVIHFGAVDYFATVWLNGQLVG